MLQKMYSNTVINWFYYRKLQFSYIFVNKEINKIIC
jgi:hypothetical protein